MRFKLLMASAVITVGSLVPATFAAAEKKSPLPGEDMGRCRINSQGQIICFKDGKRCWYKPLPSGKVVIVCDDNT